MQPIGCVHAAELEHSLERWTKELMRSCSCDGFAPHFWRYNIIGWLDSSHMPQLARRRLPTGGAFFSFFLIQMPL